MSDHITDSARPPLGESDFSYPWAAAPDIIRSNQKDAYFENALLSHLSSAIRSLYGARTAHRWNNEAKTLAELLYLGLTTFVGNRTLGEEYCDIVQVEDDTFRLPSLVRRAGYILSSVLLPYFLSHILPAFRRRVRAKLESTLRKSHSRRASSPASRNRPQTSVYCIQAYILKHLDTLTSPAPIYALSLAVFYFSGAYYQISKRMCGLRYIFTRKQDPSEQRGGYEVLGVLLVLQLIVQAYIHIHTTYRTVSLANEPAKPSTQSHDTTSSADTTDYAIAADDDLSLAAPTLLFETPRAQDDPAAQQRHLSRITHTPLPKSSVSSTAHRYDLGNAEVMLWIDGKQQRKCTLCLEPMKDPSVTTCGHVFCWQCVRDWLREQPMCPLCRQRAVVEHVLPLRG